MDDERGKLDMMHYAQVILEAKSLGFDDAQARDFARRVVTAAALMSVMPEDVLKAWKARLEKREEDQPILETLSELDAVMH